MANPDSKMKRVLLRVDFNEPVKNKRVLDNFRILSHKPSIEYLVRKGWQIFLIAHLDYGGKTPHLDFLAKYLAHFLKTKVTFVKGRISAVPRSIKEQIVLLDNIRLNPGEENNSSDFARKLAKWGDVYVNDAFAVSHREHASIVGLPKYLPSQSGPLLRSEILNLSKAFKPQRPFLFVLGGKKFETKEPLIRKFLKKADKVFIGGALANSFLCQRGIEIGKSDHDDTKIPKNILNHKKIILPEDVYVLRGNKRKIISIGEIRPDDFVYDAGPNTLKKLGGLVFRSKFVLWNGTLGFCEDGFVYGTKTFAISLGKSKAFRIVGGGDTVAAIRQFKLTKNFDFISTGGGAMLEFLATGTLPGIDALKKKR
jgi:phosphoglycerate kinase